MRRLDALLIGLPLVYLVAFLPGPLSAAFLYETTTSHNGYEGLHPIGRLVGHAATLGGSWVCCAGDC